MRTVAAWLVLLGLLAADLGFASELVRGHAQGARSRPAPNPESRVPEAPADDMLPAPLADDSMQVSVSFDPPSQKSLRAAIERPLFSPGRRPPKTGNTPVEPPSARLSVDLAGVVISDQQRIAVLLKHDRAEALRLEVGQEYAGWRLTSIEPLSATFERDGQTRKLDLVFDVPEPPEPSPQDVQPRQKAPQQATSAVIEK